MNRLHTPLAAAVLATLALLAGCTRSTPDAAVTATAAAATDDHIEEASPLELDVKAMEASGVRVEPVTAGPLGERLNAPGEVVDNAYGVTLITPRVAALVVRRHARLGDEVRAGAPLVTLSSVEVAEAQGDLRIAEQEWHRVQSLGREAVSGRRYAEAAVEFEQAQAKALAYGLPGRSTARADGEFTMYAPHGGRLTEDEFVIGQRIEPGYPLFRLVDESIVWIDAKLPAEVARRVVVGSEAVVSAGGATLRGKVVQGAHRTAEDTRNAHVRIEVRNDDDLLHAGDFVEVSLEAGSGTRDELAVPTSALVQIKGQSVVFRERAEGAFESVPVRIGAVVGDRTVVSEGLAAGDRIAVAGAYALKARLLKVQMGEGHGH
jgi:cobalt-zinc-cadmium efflux system membrane fusion protein